MKHREGAGRQNTEKKEDKTRKRRKTKHRGGGTQNTEEVEDETQRRWKKNTVVVEDET